jgi:hypothetical protein
MEKLTKEDRKFLKHASELGIGGALDAMGWDEAKLTLSRSASRRFDDEYLAMIGISKRQEQFLQLYVQKVGNIDFICKSLGVSRHTYYYWIDHNEKFKALVEDAKQSLIDFTESMLYKNIQEGKENSIFFLLRTKGRARGYTETTEVTTNLNVKTDMLSDAELDAKIQMLSKKLSGAHE